MRIGKLAEEIKSIFHFLAFSLVLGEDAPNSVCKGHFWQCLGGHVVLRVKLE